MGCACRRQTPLIRVNNSYGLNLSNFPQKEIIPFVKYEKIPFLDIANMKKRKGRFMHYGYKKHNKSRMCVKEGEYEPKEGGDGDGDGDGGDINSNNNDKCNSNIEHNDNVIANEISCNKDNCYKYNNNIYSTYCDEYVHNDVSPKNNNKGDK